jgi:N-acetylmuramic acid 6-phosphate etherase
MAISAEARARATDFLENETQFHLGMLPTEQSNPKTRGLDTVFAESPQAGVDMLFSVDEDIVPMAERVLAGAAFAEMLDHAYRVVIGGGKIVFSGCGATGRLSILLESMWRTFFRKLEADRPELFAKLEVYEDTVFSIMTGGDYALIKSVESFEDYPQFGRRQAQELGLNARDVLIAITEGGETSSVLGTVAEALDVGAKPFLLFNNPADILATHIERSRVVIEDPRVTVLDLFCGPMAVAGSTRMQATSSEQLIGGALLEKLLSRLLGETLTSEEAAVFPDGDLDYAAEMKKTVANLRRPKALAAIADYLKQEEGIYRANGLVTYFVDDFLIDIFTDTTERAPTFMLAPFRKFDDLNRLPSWAFVKTPHCSTPDAWARALGRDLRCLEWTTDDYLAMRAPDKVIDNQPAVSREEMLKFLIGNEEEACRFASPDSAAVFICSGNEYASAAPAQSAPGAEKFGRQLTLIVGDAANVPEAALLVPGTVPLTNLKLMDHMMVKLTLNAISTGTMVCLGKVKSNWMSFVSMSNKKLVDRCIRLISELAGVSYKEACLALHQSIVELEGMDFTGREEPSPVQYTLTKMGDAIA